MSSVSVTLSKEKTTAELTQELESLKATNTSLHNYLNHLRIFKKNLAGINENMKVLSQVNSQWINTVKK